MSKLKSRILTRSIHNYSDQYETQHYYDPSSSVEPTTIMYLSLLLFIRKQLQHQMKWIINGQEVTWVIGHKVISSEFERGDMRHHLTAGCCSFVHQNKPTTCTSSAASGASEPRLSKDIMQPMPLSGQCHVTN